MMFVDTNTSTSKNEQDMESNYINWQKEFVSGKQFTFMNIFDGTVTDYVKQFYWQYERVFNLIKTTVDRWVAEYDAELIWGHGKAVDQLIPYQQQYNLLMNKISQISDRIAYPVLCVEDGSVDTDELGEEGLAPGKLIVYRQGSNRPELLKDNSSDVTVLYTVALGVKNELLQLMDDLEENF